MTKEKKDLTRIEDLDDFIHGENASEDDPSLSDDLDLNSESDEGPPDLPDFPSTKDSFLEVEASTFDNFSESSQEESESLIGDNSGPTLNDPTKDESSIKTLPSDEDLAFPDPSDFQTNSFSFIQDDEIPPQETLEPTDILNQNEESGFEIHEELKVSQVIDDASDSKHPESPTPLENEKINSHEALHLTSSPVASTEEPDRAEVNAGAETIASGTPVINERENFAEVRSFAEHAVLSDVMADSNPSFSVMAHGIKFVEDSEDIMLVLRELKFPEELMGQFQRQIERGSLLVPRISEFTAIYLCHKLRRFRLNLQMGLSDLIHASRGKSEQEKGLVSKRSLGQNQHHHFNFREDPSESRNILLSTLGQLDGHIIEKYLGVASEHAFLDSDQVEDDVSEAINASYDELAQKLKGHALEQKANAVVGINYQLTPMPSDNPSYGHFRYKLTCTGNLVWVNRLSV